MPSRAEEDKAHVAATADQGSLHDMDGKPGDGKVTEVQGDSTFFETVTAAPLNPRSKTSFQLYAILLVAALNATASGFDGVSLILNHPLGIDLFVGFGQLITRCSLSSVRSTPWISTRNTST